MTAAPRARTTKPRTLTYNALAGALFVTVGKDEYGYWLDVLPHDQGEAVRCYRFTKFVATRKEGEPVEYDVLVDLKAGSGSCECKGHLRWGHKTVCRHVAALLALHQAGKLS